MSDTSMYELPPLPRAIGLLRTDQSAALSQRYPTSVMTLAACITCKGTKTFRWYNAANEVVTFRCPCADQYVLSRWLWNCGIFPNYQTLGWRDLENAPPAVIEAVFEYLGMIDKAMEYGMGMVISGPKGTGKTLLAHLILKEVIAKGVDAYSTSFTQMIDTFAKGWRDEEQSRWFNSRLRDAGILYVDDLGRERNKGPDSVGENMLETVIRHRVACKLPTIISTNVDSDKVGEAYGSHTASLLTECSIPLYVSGVDARRDVNNRSTKEMTLGLTRPVVIS